MPNKDMVSHESRDKICVVTRQQAPTRSSALPSIMAPIAVHIKHAGKSYDVQLDIDLPPKAFKEGIYQVTGIPVDRMKVMIKGGMLKVSYSCCSH